MYFDKSFIEFYKKLAANNNREWFHENKKEYENSVKVPFYNFVDKLISEIKKIDPAINIETKKAIFRINRDIRFSVDKTPYKLHSSAVITPGIKKGKDEIGFYIEMSAEHFAIFGGAWSVSKDELYKIRKDISISNNFEQVLKEKSFVENFGSIQGDKNVRVNKEFTEIAKSKSLILHKQFYFLKKMSPESILKGDLIDEILSLYKCAQPVITYMRELIS